MPTTAPLLIDLTGVARLADVQRPVVSMWRSRFSTSDDPFPPSIHEKGGRPYFDALSVAQWLTRTDHGNNPDAIADAATTASPADFDIADASDVARIDALLTVNAVADEPLAALDQTALHRIAQASDPDDSCLVAETTAANPSWMEWAHVLADAAYSPLAASRILERRHTATRAAQGSAGPLSAQIERLLGDLARGLARGLAASSNPEVVVNAGILPTLASELAARIGDDTELIAPADAAGRAVRRRRLLEGLPVAPDRSGVASTLLVTRLPAGDARLATEMLRVIDDLVLEMRDADRAIVVAPASVLTERLSSADVGARADVMRSGRVRAIVKLPAGLVTSAPREALALWVLGRETGDVPISDRFTAVADLTAERLTAATRADLTSDVLAAMGSAIDVRGHAFRFARLVRTASLLASRGGLIPQSPRAAATSVRDLPALLDQARERAGVDVVDAAPATSPAARVHSSRVDALVASGHLRVLPGVRMAPDEDAESGLVAITAESLDHPTSIGARRIDPMVFASRHPTARLTAPGDIVFRTAPTPAAWVDPDGSKVVAYPARIMRINAADPGGLVPELIAADVATATGGPGSWRRWTLRRVAPSATAPLRRALADIAATRQELQTRITDLDHYADTLTAAVVAGAVTLTTSDIAAGTASAPQ